MCVSVVFKIPHTENLIQIYETFGPTSQPLYQIKFNQSYPLDTEKIRVAREVYHVPQRSNFVFMDYLKKLRGSDASNIHDEEPGDDEIEFSDDEQESAFKQARKKKYVYLLKHSPFLIDSWQTWHVGVVF